MDTLELESYCASYLYYACTSLNKKNAQFFVHRIITDFMRFHSVSRVHKLLATIVNQNDIDNLKINSVKQARHVMNAILYQYIKDLGGQMHVNGDGAVNFPKYDGIKENIDGSTYFTE